jgi:hypothetical protein
MPKARSHRRVAYPSGRSGLLFRRNSVTGSAETLARPGRADKSVSALTSTTAGNTRAA